MRDDDGPQPASGPRRRYRPPRGLWVTLPWRVWLPLAAVLVGLSAITGAYISAAVALVILVFVAYLRVRERRVGADGGR
jgi:hypothetical protein